MKNLSICSSKGQNISCRPLNGVLNARSYEMEIQLYPAHIYSIYHYKRSCYSTAEGYILHLAKLKACTLKDATLTFTCGF